MDRSLGSDGSLRVVVAGDEVPDGLEPATGASAAIDGQVLDVDSVRAHDEVLARADLLVSAGETPLLAAVRAGVEVPVLPAAGPAGVASITLEDLEAALESVVDGEYATRQVPTLAVEADGDSYRGLMDVMAVTSEAAKISEYEVARVAQGEEHVLDRIRADGMVAAAPAGTPGYGTAAGGPILGPDLRAVTVVPVGPFRIEQPHWVLEPPVSIRVVREEVPVALLVDDREVGSMAAGTAVTIDWGPPVTVVTTPQSRSGVVSAGGQGADG